MMQHSLPLWNWLHPLDVRAVIDRPRAISNCPYKFYCRKYVFCNTPIVLDIVFSDDFRGAFQNQPGDPAFLSLNGDI